jgi:DNA-binding Xre family transcriptional regulator
LAISKYMYYLCDIKLHIMEFRIKEILKDKGMLYKELAERIGISDIALRASLSRNPTLGTLQRVADALGVPVTELFVPTPTDTLRCPHCGGVIKIEKGE